MPLALQEPNLMASIEAEELNELLSVAVQALYAIYEYQPNPEADMDPYTQFAGVVKRLAGSALIDLGVPLDEITRKPE